MRAASDVRSAGGWVVAPPGDRTDPLHATACGGPEGGEGLSGHTILPHTQRAAAGSS